MNGTGKMSPFYPASSLRVVHALMNRTGHDLDPVPHVASSDDAESHRAKRVGAL